MPVLPATQTELSTAEVLTSEERWRRWEQRGFDNDARFMRRAIPVFWTAVTLAAAVLLLSLRS